MKNKLHLIIVILHHDHMKHAKFFKMEDSASMKVKAGMQRGPKEEP